MSRRPLPVILPDPPGPESMPEFVGTPNGEGRRFAVVASRFNETITRPLAEGAVDALVRHGATFEDVDLVWVPGAWELPVVGQVAAPTAVLVRPDGHVAWIGEGSVEVLTQALTIWFGVPGR